MPHIPSILEVSPLEGLRVLVRSELNVPLEDGKVANPFRLRRALDTITFLRDRGARVIVVSHLGRDPKASLAPVAKALEAFVPLVFVPTLTGTETKKRVAKMQNGEVLMLENLRSDAREKENDEAFARELAALADFYVNDAFGASHRAHASIVGLPGLLPSAMGISFAEEVKYVSQALAPRHPSLLILGGAKFATKLPLLEAALERYTHLFVGGALANNFFRAQGIPVGASLVSDDCGGEQVLRFLNNPKLLLPLDVSVTGPRGTRVCTPKDIASDEQIVDCGPETVTMLGGYITEAKMVIWNGPLGNYEQGFFMQTQSTAALVADAPALSYVGGGDTVAAIEELGLGEAFTFLSTAGGAMIDFLVDGKLAGIEALAHGLQP